MLCWRRSCACASPPVACDLPDRCTGRERILCERRSVSRGCSSACEPLRLLLVVLRWWPCSGHLAMLTDVLLDVLGVEPELADDPVSDQVAALDEPVDSVHMHVEIGRER